MKEWLLNYFWDGQDDFNDWLEFIGLNKIIEIFKI